MKRQANLEMKFKTLLALALFVIPFLFILSGVENLWLLWSLWLFMGLAKSFVGTSVMHDALHGSYSKKKWVNNLVGFCAYLIGANPKMWHLQHNVLHHTYTNIDDADEDISPRFVLRFTPNQPHRWFHKYQHLYASFFYLLSILTWVTVKDFLKLFEYRKNGLINSQIDFRKYFTTVCIHRLLYFVIFLGLPILLSPHNAWLIVAMYLGMEAVTGITLTLIFQTAHVMPESHFIKQEEEMIQENWAIHQLQTTTNYGNRNRFLTWVTGSLNFQIEHHLFPDICHIHYPAIAPIVKRTAREFNLPYRQVKSFRLAIRDHFLMLKKLGKEKPLEAVAA